MAHKTRVFISYAHRDKAFVENLVQDLTREDPGLDIWYDVSLRVDDDWERELRNQMADSHYCVVVLSRNIYNEGEFRSKWVPREIEWALAHEADRHRPVPFRIFPVRIDDCEIPERLQETHKEYADFQKSYRHGMDKLVYRMISLEKYRSLFVDRRRELGQCLAIFHPSSRCHAQIVYHKDGKRQMGSTFLLRYLENQVAVASSGGSAPFPIYFEPEVVTNPMGWLEILNRTVRRVGEEYFQLYRQTLETCIDSSRRASEQQRPGPGSAHDLQPTIGARGIELFGRRVSPRSGHQALSYTGILDRLDWRLAETLTTVFLQDLERAPIPGVVWLIDGPSQTGSSWVGPVDHMMYDWLIDMLNNAIRGTLPKVWIVAGGRYPPIPANQIPRGIRCVLDVFDRQAVEEYLDRRLHTADAHYKAMVAILVLRHTRHPAEVCQYIENLIREVANG